MAICKICGKPVTTGVVVHTECIAPWITTSDSSMPDEFVTVQIHVPSEAPLPTVLPAYLCPGGVFCSWSRTFNLGEVTHWAPMNKPPEGVWK